MPTKNEIKFIKSLKQKKNREQANVFIAEGEKLVRHFLKLGLKPDHLFAIDDRISHEAVDLVEPIDMKLLSLLQNPPPVLAVFQKPRFKDDQLQSTFTLVLDGVRDPGNMGTILRLCDWFGVQQIVCSDDCVDVFNEKVVQASMGAVASVQAFVMTRENIISRLKTRGYQLVSTAMKAPSVYSKPFEGRTALIMGNEGQGVSPQLEEAADLFISIPAAESTQAESLNVAMATSICLSEWARSKG